MENIDINKLIMQHRSVVVVVVIILLSLLIAKNIYNKQMMHYTAIKEKIAAEKEKSEAIERIVLLNEQLQKKRGRSWDTVDFNSIVEKIFNMGLEYNVKIRDISPGEKREEVNYVVIPFALSGEATYEDLLRFVKNMEKFPMLIRINSVSVNPIGSQDVEDNLSLGVGLSAEAVYFK